MKSSILLKVLSLFLLIALFFSACDSCKDIDCFTPPGGFSLRILNQSDSIDSFYSGRYQPDSVKFYYLDDNVKRYFNFEIHIDSAVQRAYIFSNELPWKSVEGYRNFYLNLNAKDTDTLFLVIEPVTNNCCTSHPVKTITVNGIVPEVDNGGAYFYYK